MTRLVFAMLILASPAVAQAPEAKPTHFPPDDATRKVIVAKTAELKAAVAAMDQRRSMMPDDVAVYLQAVERALRLDEFLAKDSAKQTLAVLDAGLKRAAEEKAGRTPWRAVRNRAVARGYVSKIDGSVQPYSLSIPADAPKPLRLDVVLHGRDGTLTEVKFLAQKETAKPTAEAFATLEVYGRGNNAYRWAGEADLREALNEASAELRRVGPIVLRGFSMGGVGTWHYGLHDPFAFRVLGPGAGFTTTHGYAGKLPEALPDYQERCLRIYDAVRVSENVFNVPVVAYAGELDKQKAAADNVIAALKTFREPYTLTQLVAPGLEHKMPPEWMAKAETEYRKHIAVPRPARTRYVLYTTAYPYFGRGFVTGLERHYDKAVVDVTPGEGRLTVATTNVRSLFLNDRPATVSIDGQTVAQKPSDDVEFVKSGGIWTTQPGEELIDRHAVSPRKTCVLQGPIDDAFMRPFAVGPAPAGDSLLAKSLAASHARFGREWDRYFRGQLRPLDADTPERVGRVLFGTPDTPAVREVLPKLPVTWTADTLVVNGVSYDAKTHYPALIVTDPANQTRYLVLNSGHTFHEPDFKSTNALLYPRLGDWAVLKVAPTKDDPAHTETVAAGLFDEEWKFGK